MHSYSLGIRGGVGGMLGIGNLQSKGRNQREKGTKILKAGRGQIMETIK